MKYDELEYCIRCASSDNVSIGLANEQLCELVKKATAYDSKEVQDAIECDRIENIIKEKYEYDLQYSTLTYTLIIYQDNMSNEVLFRADEETKLEALTKALEWVEGRGESEK